MAEMQEILIETVAQVLEQQAFMFAEPCADEDLESPADELLQASIHFSGPVNGDLEATIPVSLGMALAANLLGIEPEDEEAGKLAQDALQEMLNVICGQTLTHLYGTGPVFQLSIPQARLLAPDQWAARPGEEWVGFLVDDEYPARVRLAVEKETP